MLGAAHLRAVEKEIPNNRITASSKLIDEEGGSERRTKDKGKAETTKVVYGGGRCDKT